jgi:hypothetical protein
VTARVGDHGCGRDMNDLARIHQALGFHGR